MTQHHINSYIQNYIEDGKILLIDKPLDWTSFDIVNKIKWKLRKKFNLKKIKVGHAGTLDPRASGLLIVCVGKATKKIQEIQNTTKVYSGIIKIGAETASYDTETEEINHKPFININKEIIDQVFSSFLGEIYQKPPIFSAIKKEGKRLYEFARKGLEIEIPERKICIYKFYITKLELPLIHFYIHCSKGTYIRSVAHEVGQKLGCGAYLLSLTREQIGDYKLEDSVSIESFVESIESIKLT